MYFKYIYILTYMYIHVKNFFRKIKKRPLFKCY
uniref:Uncharacterized protein n=1 Tax=Siphoviridae sp. ctxvK3 TaxID=2827975 RepID=A0A8S5SHA5_9CAUD|nr:MAG TPA: hypothetical protein [Siphoviridae sp. ctxvK3]